MKLFTNLSLALCLSCFEANPYALLGILEEKYSFRVMKSIRKWKKIVTLECIKFKNNVWNVKMFVFFGYKGQHECVEMF